MIICERRRNISPTSFPPFHSLSTNRGDYWSFQMTMTETNVNSSKLVSKEIILQFIFVFKKKIFFYKFYVSNYNFDVMQILSEDFLIGFTSRNILKSNYLAL
jgi:hypothetical protein